MIESELLAAFAGYACYGLLACSFIDLAQFSISLEPPGRLWLRDVLHVTPVQLTPAAASHHDNAVMNAVIDLILIALFFAQHSIMSRLSYQSAVSRRCGQAGERVLHLIASCAAARLLTRQWRHIPQSLYDLSQYPFLCIGVQLLSMASFLFLLLSLVTVAWYDLFRYCAALTGQSSPSIPSVVPFVYRCTRQPLFSAVLGIIWCNPSMVSSH